MCPDAMGRPYKTGKDEDKRSVDEQCESKERSEQDDFPVITFTFSVELDFHVS
jgi:hypothetical protein